MTSSRTLSIVGVGPRGSYALENLVKELNQSGNTENIEVLLFEVTPHIGNGPVYDVNQAESNWININERILHLAAREEIKFGNTLLPEFPSYHEWVGKDYEEISDKKPDPYPPRKQVGQYLQERFQSLFKPLKEAGIVSLIESGVENISLHDSHLELTTADENSYEADEVLLTIGHQSTQDSKQILTWKAYADNNEKVKLFTYPYPISQFTNCEMLDHKSSIGLRGFGLAMMDVVRGIAEEYGTFEKADDAVRTITYKTDLEIKNLFVPFSLNGLPMSPKPLNAKIDKWFEPTKTQFDTFREIVANKTNQRNAQGQSFLVYAISPIIAEIYNSLPRAIQFHFHDKNELEALIQNWLLDEEFDHPLVTSRQQPALDTMRAFVGMATGTADVNLDYCITQVWRYCQPIMYQELSFNACNDEVFAEIIKLDERLKRYTYGPPVASVQQLIALTEAEVMNLDTVNNPEIELTEKGWILKKNVKSNNVNIMINSVLDPPKLKAVNSSIVKNLLDKDLIQAIHDDFGVHIDNNCYVLSKNKAYQLPIALLGRLAKGTVIGVDAILECFGERSVMWATEAVKRHAKLLKPGSE